MENSGVAESAGILKYLVVSFLLAYFILYVFSPLFSFMVKPLIYWSAQPIFGITYSFEVNGYGSGDTTYNYLQMFWHLMFSIMLTFPIAYIIRRRNSYHLSRYGLLLLLRIFVACMMIVYGIAKLFPAQFPEVSLLRLSQPYGESSPMGLAWTFMQYSPVYAGFTGLAEIIGGVLLLWRRTATFGALVLFGVVSNVVMMNLCYDIPVKLASVHLLAGVTILLLSDRRRIIDFTLNRISQPKEDPIVFKDPNTRRTFAVGSTVLKVACIAGLFLLFGVQYLSNSATAPLLAGSYDVQNPEESSYSNFTFDYRLASIRSANNIEKMYQTKVDTIAKSVEMTLTSDTLVKKHFKFSLTGNQLTLTSDSTKINLKRKTKADFLLMNRGFRWINERPFNR